MLMDAIINDPAWLGGDYKQQPKQGLLTASGLLTIAGAAPLPFQLSDPTRDQVDSYYEERLAANLKTLDANDLLYQVDSSRDYDPSPKLGLISAPVMWMNSADDFINPPELGIAEQKVKELKRGEFVLIPLSDKTTDMAPTPGRLCGKTRWRISSRSAPHIEENSMPWLILLLIAFAGLHSCCCCRHKWRSSAVPSPPRPYGCCGS